MKPKKWILALSLFCLSVALAVAACVGLRAAPTVNHALDISRLLQPLLDAENQTMHLAVSAAMEDTPLALESDIYLVTEDGLSYLSVAQKGAAVYISDNLLFLENGKAFKIGDNLHREITSCQDLLPHIGMLFQTPEISAEETDSETVYSLAITGDQMDILLKAASLGGTFPVESIETLHLSLTAQNGQLTHIVFSGKGNWEGRDVSLNATLSGFRVLAPGDFPIPAAVKQSVTTVDPSGLFSLTEDLYRLVMALIPLSEAETLDGTLAFTADCGPIQLDTQIHLSELQTSTDGQMDPEQLRRLPEMLGWLCMEGDISCTQSNDAYMYTLILDESAMGDLCRMLLPALSQYGANLTEGQVAILLKNNTIASMQVSIAGNISALLVRIPISLGAEFTFNSCAIPQT